MFFILVLADYMTINIIWCEMLHPGIGELFSWMIVAYFIPEIQ